MKLFRALRSAVCVSLLTVAVVGSTVSRDAAVLLHEQNYQQLVSLSDADAPFFRHFYVAVQKSPRRKISEGDIVVSPFETPPLHDGFSGTFIVDLDAPDGSGFASRLRALYERREGADPGAYLGLAASPGDPVVATFGSPRLTIGKLDLPQPGSSLSLVRFDINQWKISDGVVSYDIRISYWGRPAPAAAPETVLAMASRPASPAASQ